MDGAIIVVSFNFNEKSNIIIFSSYFTNSLRIHHAINISKGWVKHHLFLFSLLRKNTILIIAKSPYV